LVDQTNVYSYARNGPVKMSDPSGTTAIDAAHPDKYKDGPQVIVGRVRVPNAPTNPPSSSKPAAKPHAQIALESSTQTATVKPFDPMADHPVLKWLLFGKDTPILDFITSDRTLTTATYVAAGVGIVAGVIATGGALAGYLGGAATTGGSLLTSSAAAAITGVGGIAAQHPEIVEEAEAVAPQFAGEVSGLLSHIAESGELAVTQAEELAPKVSDLPSEVAATTEAVVRDSEFHHIFPQEFRDEFERMGIDIDQFTIELPKGLHHLLHFYEGTAWEAAPFNDEWGMWFNEGQKTAEDAYQFAAELLNELNLAGPEYPVVPYPHGR
jgi:hypothetical protein